MVTGIRWCFSLTTFLILTSLVISENSNDSNDTFSPFSSLLPSTSILISISSISESPTSSESPTTSGPSPVYPTPSPQESIDIKTNCLYMMASDINFNFTKYDDQFSNTSLIQLTRQYPHTDDITCDGENSVNFTRYYYHQNKPILWLTLYFERVKSDNSWHLSIAQLFNDSNNNQHIFDYGNCADAIEVGKDLSYSCAELQCWGHEQAMPGIKSEMTLHNFKVDAFFKHNSQPFAVFVSCGASTDPSNELAFIIVAIVIGVMLIVAVLIIIASFAYKRYKYGPYNLLN